MKTDELLNSISAKIKELEAEVRRLKAETIVLGGGSLDPLLLKQAGIPNIVFGYAGDIRDGEDDREPHWKEQRLKRGFDDTELWGLDCTIAQFIIPRLERYLEIWPFVDNEVYAKYREDINYFLTAMKLVSLDSGIDADARVAIVDKGLEAFPRIFRKLWF